MSKTLDYLSPFPRSSGLLSRAPSPSSVLALADRWRLGLWAFVAVCYVGGFNGQWRMQPDAALYLSIGKNLATGHGFTYLGQPNRLAFPGWPLLICAVFRIFGTSSLVPVHILMLLITAVSIACVYRLFLLHRDRSTAVVISVGVGLTKAFFCYAFELWSDLPFAMGVLMFLAGYEAIVPVRKADGRRPKSRRWYDWFLLVAGLITAVSMRPTAIPFVAAIVLGLLVDTARRRVRWSTLGIAALGFAATAAVFALLAGRSVRTDFGGVYLDYVHLELSGDSSGLLRHNIAHNLHDLFTWAASDVLFQVRFGPVFNSLLSIVVLALGVGLFRHRAMWGFWFCLLLGTILIAQESLDRYFLPVLPLLVFAWWDEITGLARRIPRPAGDLIFLFLLCFGGIVNLTKCGGIVMQQQTRPFLPRYDNGQFETVPATAAYIRDHVPADAIVIARAPFGRVLTFLSGRTVVGAAEVSVHQAWAGRIYILEPTDDPGRLLIRDADLVEDAPVFTASPAANHDWKATALSLRPAHR
jgi:hypothetical protein